MPGALPKPMTSKILAGLPGNRGVVSGSSYPKSTPAAPEWLSAYASEEWAVIVPELEAAGVLSSVDRSTIAAYCEAVATLRRATEEIVEYGHFVTRDSKHTGPRRVPNPAVAVQSEATAKLMALSREFGLGPVSRRRVTPNVPVSGSNVPNNRLDKLRERVSESRETGASEVGRGD